jgi:hypothetical protein
MPKRIEMKLETQRRDKTRELHADEIDWRKRPGRAGSPHRLAAIREGCPAAVVCLCGRSAFAFEAALGCFARRTSEREAIERSDQQNHCDQADHDLNPSPHLP